MRAAIFLAFSISLLSTAGAPAKASETNSALGKAVSVQSVASAGANAAANTDVDSSDSTADAYPRVTAIEQTILGQTFAYEPLPTRLERMERKAFNKVSDSDDLSARTDALYDYADKTLHKNPFKAEYSSDAAADKRLDGGDSDGGSGGENAAYGSGSEGAGGESGGGSDYPHVTALEKAILGESHAGDQLSDRLSRMETKAFGNPTTGQDLSDRTDALEKYAEKKLHMKPFGAEGRAIADNSSQEAGQSSRTQGLSKLAAVGNTLLNMTGFGMMGMPGFGGGMGMPGAGVMNAGQSPAPEQSLQAQKIAQQLDDPLLKSATPPPASAKLLTKVGWCEIQVFGQANAKMHLLDRLNQLNQTLNFDPGKTGLDLMDHIDGLMKLAETRKSSGQSVGTVPAPVVH
ncbi:MAG: hypothetical protein K2Y39_11325 [Candidatus Obscuribacterales bacterium]|nr:hypothetical protein [Candidatus Obscuribacterales bacterium]